MNELIIRGKKICGCTFSKYTVVTLMLVSLLTLNMWIFGAYTVHIDLANFQVTYILND